MDILNHLQNQSDSLSKMLQNENGGRMEIWVEGWRQGVEEQGEQSGLRERGKKGGRDPAPKRK